MGYLSEIIELNRDIILFVYGLVFFVLGLAIALQSRSHSRLELARSLKWLAAFGLAHGVYEWGLIFIPYQAAYLDPTVTRGLWVAHLLLLAISFLFLLQFGLTLVKVRLGWRFLDLATPAMLVLWASGTLWMGSRMANGVQEWVFTGNALARYLMAFPGGLLGAYGLHLQAEHRIRALNLPHLVVMLRVASLMLFLYAFLAGLVVPPVDFFPGVLLNHENFRTLTGFPIMIFRSLVGLGLSVAMIRALEVFNIETARLIEKMEQGQILAAERERIGRDLHDGAIQTVYTAGLLVESAARLVEPGGQVGQRLEKAVTALNDAIRSMRSSLVELTPDPQGESLPMALRKLVLHPQYESLLSVDFECQAEGCEQISRIQAEHIYSIVREALSNAVRHAAADTVKVSVQQADSQLVIEIRDDGRGLPAQLKAGYGLRNMHDRARLVGGQLDVTPLPGKGTLVRLVVPQG